MIDFWQFNSSNMPFLVKNFAWKIKLFLLLAVNQARQKFSRFMSVEDSVSPANRMYTASMMQLNNQ